MRPIHSRIRFRSPSPVFRSAVAVFVVVGLTACDGAGARNTVAGGGPGTPPAQEEVFLWLSAWEDTYAVSSPGNANVNYGRSSTLLLGRTNVSRSELFVRFQLPGLPAGSVVEEAYLQLFANDQLAGYPSQAAQVPIHEVDPWQAPTVTWDNRPLAQALRGYLNVVPNDWARSGNLAGVVQRHVDDPNTNNGFALTSDLFPAPVPAINFVSLGNDHTPSMFGLSYTGLDVSAAPRLLVRVKLPVGATAADVVAPPSDNPSDRLGMGDGSGFFPAPPRMLLERGGAWPVAWNVR